MNILGAFQCFFLGHNLEAKSIINFSDKRNYLKKCKRCGNYVAKSVYGTRCTISEKTAFEWLREFYDEFPYAEQIIYEREVGNDGKEK